MATEWGRKAAPWTCWKCQRGDRRRTGRSDLCQPCHAALAGAGQFWCHGCKQVRPERQRARRGCCHDCAAAYECARRGYGAPAPGYVSATEAAARLCLTPKAVRHRCLVGQMPGAVQRGGRFGKWWIPEEALCH